MSCAIICFYYSLRKVVNGLCCAWLYPVTAGMLLNRIPNEI